MVRPSNIKEFTKLYNSANSCLKLIQAIRYPIGFTCQLCKSTEHWINNRGISVCKNCRTEFSDTAGTLFSNSKLTLSLIFKAIWLLSDVNKSLSAVEFQKELNISYPSAWIWRQRIMRLMHHGLNNTKLEGTVYIHKFTIGNKDKTPIAVAFQLKNKQIVNIRAGILIGASDHKFIKTNLSKDSQIFDGTKQIRKSNQLETLIKQALFNIFGNYSCKLYLDAYLQEFAFRYNNQHLSQADVFKLLLNNAVNQNPITYTKTKINRTKQIRIVKPTYQLYNASTKSKKKNNNNVPQTDLTRITSNKTKKDKVNWVDIADDLDNTKQSELTFVDVFSGAGGLSKGFKLAGLIGIAGLDFLESACATYKKNFNHPIICGDIRLEKTKNKFYKTVEKKLDGRKLNVVVGGFPCQGFSMSGNRVIDDPRNSLYKELLDIVINLQPDFVVCENVVGLRSMLGGKVEKMIIADFKQVGYKMNVTVLNAVNYGVAQKRERVIFIGNRIGLKNSHPKPIKTPDEYITIGDAINDLINMPDNARFNHITTQHTQAIAKRMMALEEGMSLYKGYSDSWRKCHWNQPSSTIKENHGCVNIHPKLPRVLTARELARLQSFPDDFIFKGSKNQQLVQIGNAVPVLLAKAIGLAVRNAF